MKIEYTLEDFDNGKIIDKFGLQPNGNANLFLANASFKRMHKYTPKDTGTMATTVTIKPGKIIYEEEYAIYQYYGYTKGKVKNYTTPGTGSYWDRKMKINEGHLLAQEVSNYIKRFER